MICPITGEPHCYCRLKNQLNVANTIHPKETLRKLFTDHVMYIKFVMMDIIEQLPNLLSDIERLLNNQEEIGQFMGQWLGEENGYRLSALLKEHIQLAVKCMYDILSNKSVSLSKHVEKLFHVGHHLCKWIHDLFTYQQVDLQTIFYEHNQMIIELTIAQFMHDTNLVSIIYDSMYTHMLYFSDQLYSFVQA